MYPRGKSVVLAWTVAFLATAARLWAYAFETDSSNFPVKWEGGTITMQLHVDNLTALSDGTTRATAIQAAMLDLLRGWNHNLGSVQFTSQILSVGSSIKHNGVNEVSFDSSIYGMAFDQNILAITEYYYQGEGLTDTDIIFNTAYGWDSYRGNLKGNGVYDVQRVALHELGHVLGLAHPDQYGQTVVAVMNSIISNTDGLTADDIAGAQVLYGAPGFHPANDNFASAASLVFTNGLATASGSNIGATKEAGEPNHGGDPGGRSIWWKFTATTSGALTVDTSGSNLDTLLGVYTGNSVGELTTIASNDDVSAGTVRTSIATFSITSGTTYYLAVDGWNGESGAIQLNVNNFQTQLPTFTLESANQTVFAGSSVAFSVLAYGVPEPTLQWQRLPAGTTTWLDLSDEGLFSGTTTQQLGISATTLAMNGDQFRMLAGNLAGSATSTPYLLTVLPLGPPLITQQPVSARGKTGSVAMFHVGATGVDPLSYQWFLNGQGVWTGADLSVTISPSTAGTYTVAVSDAGGTAVSNPAALTLFVAAGDFNGDGYADLFWSNAQTGERRFWQMNGTAYGSEVSLGSIPGNWIASGFGDFNGDGQPDLLWTDTSTGERRIWLMNGTAPGGQVSLGVVPVEWTIGGTGDFNGDGKTDIFWENTLTGAHVFWLMNGTTFGSQAILGPLLRPADIQGVADFDHDGRPDLVWRSRGTGECSIWLMNGLAQNRVISLGIVPADLDVSGVEDFDGDGSPDLLLTNRVTGERSVWMIRNFVHVGTVSLGAVPLDWMPAGDARPRVQLAKLNFWYSTQGGLLWENTSTGEHYLWTFVGTSFANSYPIGTIPLAWHLATSGDFNADGMPDLVWENTITGEHCVWLMASAALYQSRQLPTMPPEWHLASTSDFNGDAKADLVWENTVTGERYLWLMDGTTFQASVYLGTIAVEWHIVDAADFNGDGQPDLVWENSITGEHYIWLMNGTAFAASVNAGTLPTEWHLAAAADFNNDSQPDLVWENRATGERFLWLMNGTSFASGVPLPTIPVEWRIIP